MFSISPVSSSLEGMSLLGKSTSWSSEFEWPNEVVGFLEMWANGVDFVDQIFEGGNSVLAESVLDESVVGERDSLLVDFTETSFINEFANSFTRWISILFNLYPKVI